jgi:hypothetical protein
MTESEIRRANELRAQMEKAINEGDIDGFRAAYARTLSHYYMPAKERKAYYKRFIERAVELRDEENNT